MERSKQNEVLKVVWPWRVESSDDGSCGKGHLRRVFVQVAVMTVVGIFLYFPWNRVVMGRVVWAMAVLVLISGLFILPVFIKIEYFGKWVGQVIATGLTWVLLVPFFYLIFMPIRLLNRLRKKDPLCRKFLEEASTYWIPRPPVRNKAHYRKQH